MPQKCSQPLVETPAEVTVAEDHSRLAAAFAEAVKRENDGWVAAAEARLELEQARQELEQARQELEQTRADRDRIRQDMEIVLASPTWRAGRLVTALPRKVRDRR